MSVRFVKVALFTFLYTISSFALAEAPRFAAGGYQMKSDLLVILTPFFGIAIIALGVLAWIGKIHWGWVASACVGAILVFSNDQIVSWLKGLFT